MKSKGLGRGLSALLPEASVDETPQRSLTNIPVSDIRPNPQQPRRDFSADDLASLSASIRQKGIIQPLIVRDAGDGYELVAGERRLRAAKEVGLDTVPVRVIDVSSDTDMLELSLVENLQRNDLNAIELAEGYRSLIVTWGLTQETAARRVGKERATVANYLRLLELPIQIQSSLRKGEISVGHAKALLSLKGVALQSALWKRILKDHLSVRQTEEAAKLVGVIRIKRPKSHQTASPFILECTDRIRNQLSTKVKIVRRGRKGSIRIDFYSDEDLERLVELLEGHDTHD